MTASVPQGATLIPKSPGPPPAPDASRISIEDAQHYVRLVLSIHSCYKKACDNLLISFISVKYNQK